MGHAALFALALALAAALAPQAGRAQALAASVNGDPVTTYDVEERVRLRKALRQPVTHEGALDELVGERIRFREAKRFGGDASGDDLARSLARIAAARKLRPEGVLDALRKAGVSEEHLRASLRTRAAWDAYVKARNKGLEAGENEVRAAMRARQGNSGSVDYTLREMTFVIAADLTPAQQAQRMKSAEEVRAQFRSCAEGPKLLDAYRDVTLKKAQVRGAASLPDVLRETFDKTPIGQLTPPARGKDGIVMIAICDRRATRDDSVLRAEVVAEIIEARLKPIGEGYYRDLRAKAVIVRK